MDNNEQSVSFLLNKAYSFLSISGKNTDFLASISNDDFFFREPSEDLPVLCVPAGGKITYTVPVKFQQAPLPYAILLLVNSGEGTVAIKEESCSLSAGDVLFLPPESSCSFSTARTPFVYDIFYLTGDVLSAYLPFLCGEDVFFHRSRLELDSTIWQLLPKLTSLLSANDTLSCLHISAMLCLALSALAQDTRPLESTDLPTHIVRMKEIFDSDYRSPHSLSELETLLGISRYRLCHDFSKYIGMSPLQYLNNNRLEAARHLLRTTSLNIREVGAAVGIENTTHFINLFKKNTGITPLQFRQTSVF